MLSILIERELGVREASREVDRVTAGHHLVALDKVKLGDIEELRSLNVAGVHEVRYYNAGQPMRRWGSGHEHGAIDVITATNPGTP